MENIKNNIFLFIDLSYFIFHTYYAKKKYYEIQKKETTDLINNKEFIEQFSNFDKKLTEIKKKLKLDKDIKVIFAKDCRRDDIWRNNIYSEYKQTRKVNNEVGDFFKYTYNNLIQKYNYLECENCEADDLIGILTKNLYKDNKVYIITGDHDYLQLLYENVEIYDMKLNNLRNKSLGNRYNDLLHKILIGDKSDNIPAIHKKLGPKTVLKYLENNDELKKKLEDPDIFEIYNRNKILIDMDNIPDNLKKNIKKKFLETTF
tara:strand:- start:8 stop:787 length:780 start_codon:yes stop_codon:yes gene_type:complete